MRGEKITILLCVNGEKGNNKSILDRKLTALRYAIESAGLEYTYNYDKHYDIVHMLNLEQYKAYIGISKHKKANPDAPVILSTFNDYNDFNILSKTSENNEKDYMKLISKTYKSLDEVDEIVCNWESQKLILKHNDLDVKTKVINPGVKDYVKSNYMPQELDAFRKYYRITNNRKIIISYGEYDYSKGMAELAAVARIMPDYEFFFFGGKLSSVSHYGKVNNIKNLHIHAHLHRELYHSAIFSTTALFIPYKYHVDSNMILEMMKANVPVVAAKCPFLYNLLIDNKTALLGDDVEDFYNCLKNIETKNYVKEAKIFADQYSIDKYGNNLSEIYHALLLGGK